MLTPSDQQNNPSDPEDRRGPRIFFPPPLIAISLVLAGWLVDHYWWALTIGDIEWTRAVGNVLLVASLVLIIVSALPFWIHKTSLEPWEPTSTIIQTGVYKFSRNPIYLAFCIASVGSGFTLNSFWVLVSVLPLVLVLRFAIIRREEVYLEGKFGQPYLDYKSRVRRWI